MDPLFKLHEDAALRDFLESVNAWAALGVTPKALDAAALELHNNGLSLTGQLKHVSPELFELIGIPKNMIRAVSFALDQKPFESPRGDFVHEEKKQRVISNPFEALSSPIDLKTSPREPTHIDPVARAFSDVFGETKSKAEEKYDHVPVYMGSSKAEAAEYEICRICRDPFSELPKEFLEPCFHLCCREHLLKYLRDQMASKKDLVCPQKSCAQPLSDIFLRSFLPQDEYEAYLDVRMQEFMSSEGSLITCPRVECGFTGSLSRGGLELATSLAEVTEKTDTGKLLSLEAFRHFQEYRIRCPQCQFNFCSSCNAVPYHKGYTCASWKEYQNSRQCRFCHDKLTSKNRSSGIIDCCNKKDCITRRDNCCEHVLPCGCRCYGILGESEHPPCLKCDLGINGEYCPICFVEALEDAPCIVLRGGDKGCNHAFHFHCARNKIASGYSGARITFGFRCCPIDKYPLEHPALEPVLTPVKALQARVSELAIQRLDYESRRRDPDLANPGGRFYQDPVGYALHVYLFFMCYNCKKPYFAGGYQCQEASAEFDPADLVCPACQPKSDNVQECTVHGKDWIAFKCRFCCQIANWFCWQKTHFCDNCHQTGTWQTLVEFQKGINKKAIWEYPQCSSLVPKIEAVKKKYTGPDLQKQLSLLMCDASKCPLGKSHPPNGFEYSLGCTMCVDKKIEDDNLLAASKAKAAELEKTEWSTLVKKEFRSPVSCPAPKSADSLFLMGGIIHFLGTFARRREFANPAKGWMISVGSSDLVADSDPGSSLCNLLVPGKFCSESKSEMFLEIQFDSKIAVELTGFALLPHPESKDDAPDSWILSSKTHEVTVLHTQKKPSLTPRGPPVIYPCHAKKPKPASIFRLQLNSSKSRRLCLGGIELFGTLSLKP